MVLYIGIIQISKKYTRSTFQTWHTCLECIFDVNNEKQICMGIIEVNFEIFEFVGTQTIEGSKKFQSPPLFGLRKMLIS
jgi:hypothetical protein